MFVMMFMMTMMFVIMGMGLAGQMDIELRRRNPASIDAIQA
jgi:hypothetical protein